MIIDEKRESLLVKNKIIQSVTALSQTFIDTARHAETAQTKTTLFVPGEAPGAIEVAALGKRQTFFKTVFFDGAVFQTVIELGTDYLTANKDDKELIDRYAAQTAVKGYIEQRPHLTSGRVSLQQTEIAEQLANRNDNFIDGVPLFFFVDVLIDSLPHPEFVRHPSTPGASPFPSLKSSLRCHYSGKTKRFHFLEIR